MLKGALNELRIGRTDRLAVDIGPVITAEAQAHLEKHVEAMRMRGRKVEQKALAPDTARGTFVPPTIIEIESIAELEREVFGPVLHVIRYRRDGLDALIEAINATGYGLTFGLHTRLDEMVQHVTARVKAGNIYVNRNIIGAVVGVQPFGGRGLSGTGPKAGGPHYLHRLVQDVPAARSSGGQIDPALADLAVWLAEHGHAAQAQIARQLGEASQVGRVIGLPGPVGERNSYALHPRGVILLRPASTDGLFHQLAAALATGNDVIVEGELAAGRLLGNLPPRVRTRIRAGGHAVSAALVEAGPEALGVILKDLAARPGPIIPVQAAASAHMRTAGAYCLDWLVEEVSTSVNTTAAGGNASLMTLA